MNEKITLYTSVDGEERYYDGEVFLASIEPTQNKKIKFIVSKKHIFSNGHNKENMVIDTGNDAEFE